MTAVEGTPHLIVFSEAYRTAVHRQLVVFVGFSPRQLLKWQYYLDADDGRETAMVVVGKRMEEKSKCDVC